MQQTRLACVAVFEARAEQPWPPTIRALPHWPVIYDRAMEGWAILTLPEPCRTPRTGCKDSLPGSTRLCLRQLRRRTTCPTFKVERSYALLAEYDVERDDNNIEDLYKVRNAELTELELPDTKVVEDSEQRWAKYQLAHGDTFDRIEAVVEIDGKLLALDLRSVRGSGQPLLERCTKYIGREHRRNP